MERKKILFVSNTLGRGGAETALLELLRSLDSSLYEASLYVVLGQGELAEALPGHVRLLNTAFDSCSVLSSRGRAHMAAGAVKAFFRNGRFLRKLKGTWQAASSMARGGRFQADKALWRMLSDGGLRLAEEFDTAVAWLEGASAYYVADHVQAARKLAFIHIDYRQAGYTREMDGGCWDAFDRVFLVSEEAKAHFLEMYPECERKAGTFRNLFDRERILAQSLEPGGFQDGYAGMRILTVGRLVHQKGIDIAIDAMGILKGLGLEARWYVLGDGGQRRALAKKIAALGLEDDFVLCGAVGNPYPYYAQADAYVHATRFEGKSIAVQEAQALGCPIVASDCGSNREQIEDGVDGLLCELTPEAVAGRVMELLADEGLRRRIGMAAARKHENGSSGGLLELIT